MSSNLIRRAVSIILVTALPWAAAQTIDIAGVKVEPGVKVGSSLLLLNGAGLRTRAVFKVYVAALYVPQKSNDAATLFQQKGPRRINLTFLRDVDVKTFSSALNEGLAGNLSEVELQALKPQIAALNVSVAAVGDVKKGDVLVIEHGEDAATRVSLNGQPRGNLINGGDSFFAALLRNWIGARPVDDGLKRSLLGA